jgi:hypothetical protein
MQRVQAVELLDFAWIPRSLRQAAMAYLQYVSRDYAARLAPKVAEALSLSGERTVLDLCSGGSGPWPVLGPLLEQQNLLSQVTLTDAFPDNEAFAQAEEQAPGLIRGKLDPVDVAAVPNDAKGLRTIFNAFHHFPPKTAAAVLQLAVDSRAPIAIFEVVGRQPLLLLFTLLLPLISLFAVPFLPRLQWRWLAWTYLLPALPLLLAFDGVVSCLRLYSEPELRRLLQNIRDPGYRWDIGRIRLGALPVHATYLVGYPPRDALPD